MTQERLFEIAASLDGIGEVLESVSLHLMADDLRAHAGSLPSDTPEYPRQDEGSAKVLQSIIDARIPADPQRSYGNAEPIQHGVNCPKVRHELGKWYGHEYSSDGPYGAGDRYCGRCHEAL